jgi:hypothetical protein
MYHSCANIIIIQLLVASLHCEESSGTLPRDDHMIYVGYHLIFMFRYLPVIDQGTVEYLEFDCDSGAEGHVRIWEEKKLLNTIIYDQVIKSDEARKLIDEVEKLGVRALNNMPDDLEQVYSDGLSAKITVRWNSKENSFTMGMGALRLKRDPYSWYGNILRYIVHRIDNWTNGKVKLILE